MVLLEQPQPETRALKILDDGNGFADALGRPAHVFKQTGMAAMIAVREVEANGIHAGIKHRCDGAG
jgi:hypothetical protein